MCAEEAVRLMRELEHFDTPTVTNAIATYPGKETCLSLYEPFQTAWFTDERMRCLYPDLPPRCGFAVTCVYGMPGCGFGSLGFSDVLRGIAAGPAPAILVMKQNMPERFRRKNAMVGGNMMTAFRQLGVRGVIGDGPARDLEEMRPLEVQCMFTGLAPGHGAAVVEAVNVPVEVCSMAVAPGEIIHMDVNGAVKFPAEVLPMVLENAKRIQEFDTERQRRLREAKDPGELGEIMKGIYH